MTVDGPCRERAKKHTNNECDCKERETEVSQSCKNARRVEFWLTEFRQHSLFSRVPFLPSSTSSLVKLCYNLCTHKFIVVEKENYDPHCRRIMYLLLYGKY